jgi:hypothetical protein
MFLRQFIGILLLAGTCSLARGQFYAPDTERHDPVQRFFIVELARIQAWFENGKFPGINEIKYQVSTKSDGTTVWNLEWLGADGKTAKTARVEYPAKLLESGADFYRETALQVCGANWQRQLRGTDAKAVLANFWAGARALGFSREETFERIAGIERKFATDETIAIPQLAGALIHSGLFSVADRLSIDAVTVARGAAWLGFAERMAAEKFDDVWAPVLFLAGREKQAAELWQKVRPAALLIATPEEQGWNVWLRKPNPADIYRFALKKGNLEMGMPMLAYDAQVMGNGDIWVDALAQAEQTNVWRLHNYAPAMMFESFTAGRLTEGAWPALQRAAWSVLMDGFKPAPNDFAAYKAASKSAKTFFTSGKVDWEATDDRSLVGLKEASPLIDLGKSEGVGR